MSYAVIRTGGKQYRVSVGENLRVEKLEGEVGQEIEFGDLVMVKRDEEIILARSKIHDVKFKRRKGYERHLGHRQDFTEVRISSVP